jgi:hypothetical protein
VIFILTDMLHGKRVSSVRRPPFAGKERLQSLQPLGGAATSEPS